MTFTEFIRTKELFDNGSMDNIRNADLDAFLFENKWYPVRQFVAFIQMYSNFFFSDLFDFNLIHKRHMIVKFFKILKRFNHKYCS